MPFHYIHPLHQKKRISNNNTDLLEDRTEELESFLNYLSQHIDKFNLDGFWKFFDSTLAETKCGQAI